MPGLPCDLVEIVREVHAEAGGVDRALDEAAEFPGVVDDGQDLLHAAEGEDGDEEGAAALDGIVDALDEAGDLVDAFLAERALGGAAGRLHDDGVEVARGELCARQGALVLEEDVAGDEHLAVLVVDLDGGGAGDVAGRVEDDLDLVLGAADLLGVAEGQAVHALGAAVDVLVGEERVVGDVVLLLLAHHHVGGVVEHALDQHPAGRRHDDGRIRVLLHEGREAANMVQMAVRDDDQVEFLVPDQGKVRSRGAAGLFGVKTGVNHHADVAELDKIGVGADAAVTVQINKLHLVTRHSE